MTEIFIIMQTSVTLSPSSCELRVILGADVQYIGLGLPSVDTKDISRQRQRHVAELINNVENVILFLFSGSMIKNNAYVRTERCSLFDSQYTLGNTARCFEHFISSS